jgi:membrane protease YdiL (CAAX protease family)
VFSPSPCPALPYLTDPAARRRVWIEVLSLYLGSCLVIRGIKTVQEGLGLRPDWLVLVAFVFIFTPDLAERWNGFRLDEDIVRPHPFWPALRRAARWWLLLVVLIYPAFILGNHIWQTWGFTFVTRELLGMKPFYRPHHPTHGLPPDLLQQAVYQLICVGYAEEFFYRGYMQTRLDQVMGERRVRVLGADLGWSFVLTQVLFTLGHSIVTLQWWQPFILFPALLFGWLRARTGNILAGSLFHAWANTAMSTLDAIYGVGRP